MLIRFPLKRIVCGLVVGPFGDQRREACIRVVEGMGFANAEIIQVERKVSALHQTPLRLSVTQRDSAFGNIFPTSTSLKPSSGASRCRRAPSWRPCCRS